jgi:hypothetical protein
MVFTPPSDEKALPMSTLGTAKLVKAYVKRSDR